MTSLLDEAVEAHGGARRWRRASEIRARVRGGGLLMRSKLKHGKLSDYEVSASTRDQSAVIRPYPRPGATGVFDSGTVRIIAADGAVASERERARDSFSGVAGLRRNLMWDDLDALYFAGYALWNYLNLPFLLGGEGFEASEAEPLEVEGERWRRLDVSFPEGLQTHCWEQSFYFDRDLLLRRHDYSPDVISRHASAAHLSWAHREFDGLVFPTRRRVVPKGPGGRPLPGPTIVSLKLEAVSVA